MWGSAIGGCFAYSHALGGYAGSHAECIRVPYADHGAFTVPEGVSDLAALFASDAAPTGWTGADGAGVAPGDIVAVWGAGGVGQMAARGAMLMGAEQVIVIDRLPERLVHRAVTAATGDQLIDVDRIVQALRHSIPRIVDAPVCGFQTAASQAWHGGRCLGENICGIGIFKIERGENSQLVR
ncbi:hypothetical protein [Mycolicibacterium sp. 018/SC-01/001]|uniref:hypothetical protein n=1 Tax=Mycolicibacterium sp. 018/SC-01/001 TaxID=2592069 RepID=UPI0021041C9A|nr:hypothetical protein [Mycolicibacterium sp. 018/SC-01/001]